VEGLKNVMATAIDLRAMHFRTRALNVYKKDAEYLTLILASLMHEYKITRANPEDLESVFLALFQKCPDPELVNVVVCYLEVSGIINDLSVDSTLHLEFAARNAELSSDTKSCYSVFGRVCAFREEKAPSQIRLRLNRQNFVYTPRKVLKMSSVVYPEDLSEDYLKMWNQMRESILRKGRGQSEETWKKEHVYSSENFPGLLSSHHPRQWLTFEPQKPLTAMQMCFVSIMQYVLSLPEDQSIHTIMTQRELQLARYALAFPHCEVGKREELIDLYHREVPHQFRLGKVDHELHYTAGFMYFAWQALLRHIWRINGPFHTALCGRERDEQHVHSALFLSNLLAPKIGFSHTLTFDPYGDIVLDRILERPFKEILGEYWEFLQQENVLKFICNYFNGVADRDTIFGEVSKKYNDSSFWVLDDEGIGFTLSCEGTLFLLKEFGYLTRA
jgi:hypothetical protein